MIVATFPDGNGIRHAMSQNLGEVPADLVGRRFAIRSACGREFDAAIGEIRFDEPASCMTCLVREADP